MTDANQNQTHPTQCVGCVWVWVVGRHEEAHDTELWVLGLHADLKHEQSTDAFIEHKANWECREAGDE